MHYEMEELIPIVGRLAEKYTANESTSVTYEKAEQLMGAVLYCIHEAERQGPQEGDAPGNIEGASDRHPLTVTEKKLSAKQAYEAGAACVEQKARKALKLYHEILPEFQSYENECLYDTFVKGLPEFFKWYDVKFQPQNTILTMDYPVLKDISGLSGIDKVYAFIKCIGNSGTVCLRDHPEYGVRRDGQRDRRSTFGRRRPGLIRNSTCG